ncbi:ABC transporter substrate-binding protein [Algoriphagus halophytocola]|uniref:ABC transporter substrate-binding protein n=1 Tax=Algoriphagus halophytocola TaxID=2991499 RepID=A0ABY6MDU9_9BACT|nr:MULTISPECIES: ABC transporter substrate-binding protein [unclassified Algoriphagus]UZD21950.1 ABC transporter substrate-binding protein [Algoriphagus sp. TR-M5]WBL43201.1 ABC transporter substrate-binding protein [Algoriphagus sp. TR-M9]
MLKRFLPLFTLIIAACTASSQKEEHSLTERKIITAGGTITEVVHALGYTDQIIATDLTSTYPSSMQDLPSIGYRNQIKAEGILALGPDLVLIEEGYLNPDVVTQLKAAQTNIQVFTKPTSVEGTKKLVTDISAFFEAEEKGMEINASIDADIADLNAYLESQESQPKAIFIMARGPETVFIAGDQTFASEMFKLAKIKGIATGFDEFAPMTPESLVSMNPEFLVFFESGIQSVGGKDGLVAIQGIDQTTAFKEDHIVALDGQYLSGFGPRVGKAALDLAKAVRQ